MFLVCTTLVWGGLEQEEDEQAEEQTVAQQAMDDEDAALLQEAAALDQVRHPIKRDALLIAVQSHKSHLQALTERKSSVHDSLPTNKTPPMISVHLDSPLTNQLRTMTGAVLS